MGPPGGLGGIGAYLGGLLNALKGQGTPQPPAPPPQQPPPAPAPPPQGAPAAQPPTPPAAQTPNIPGLQPTFLDNPLLQGALGAYFSAIGSPKSRGLGGALSAGGLGGLQGYEAARANQLKPYLTMAQLGNLQAGTQQKLAQGQLDTTKNALLPGQAAASNDLKAAQANLDKVKADLLPGDSDARRTLEQAQTNLDNANAQLDPAKRQQLIASATNLTAQAGLANQRATEVKPLAESTIGLQGAEKELAQKRAVTEEQKPADIKAATELKQALTKTQGTVQDKNKADTDLMNIRAKYVPQQIADQTATAAANVSKATDPAARLAAIASLRKQLDAEWGWFGHGLPDATRQAYVNRVGNQILSGESRPLPTIAPAGTHPELPPGWKQDPNNPNGAWDEKGVHHTYDPNAR